MRALTFSHPRHVGQRLLALLALAQLGAQASPASELYGAATREIEENYYGWVDRDFGAFARHYEQVLETRCQTEGGACPYATGQAVLNELLTAFGDEHTYIRDPLSAARYREAEKLRAGPRTGLRVVRVEGGLLVVSVLPNSPADWLGIHRFDLLTHVNEQPAGKRDGQDLPMGPSELAQLEQGGQPILITLRRAGEEGKTMTLSTDLIKPNERPELAWLGAGGHAALINLPTFVPNTAARDFLEEVQKVKAAGIESLIIDLRFNSGGSLQQCVAAASIFGPVVYNANYQVGGFSYTGLNGGESRYLDTVFAPASQKVWTGPAAVLVGPDTASCAEVFAYYAQRAGVKVIGLPTKGVANSGILLRDLPDGGMLAVTVFRGYAPDDVPLPAAIRPDVTAPLDIDKLVSSGEDTTLSAALRALGYDKR